MAAVRSGPTPILGAPNAAMGSMHSRVARMTSEDMAACSPPTRKRLRTRTVAVESRTPLMVVSEAVTSPDSTRIDSHIRAIVAEAADFAESSPEPPPAELYTDILVERY